MKMKRERETEKFLFEFLVESGHISNQDFEYLTEDEKSGTIKELTKSILDIVVGKSKDIDTLPADRSRGHIGSLKEIEILQDAVQKLEVLVETSSKKVPRDTHKYIKEIVKAMMNINKHTADFKDGYRNKKTLVILKYQSLILSLFASVSYLISVLTDYSHEENIVLKNSIKIEEISPLRNLMDFNRAVEKGDFKLMMRDVKLMRENFVELDISAMSTLTEATDIMSLVINGVKEIYNKLDKNYKISGLIYGAIGVVLLLFSVREVFYTFDKTRTKVSDMIENIKNFGSNLGLDKIMSFGKSFMGDIEDASKQAKREIEREDKVITDKVKNTSIETLMGVNNEPVVVADTETSGSDLFNF